VEVRATDPVAATTVRRFDGASRARQLVDALGKVTARGFDADGNLVSHRDPLAIGFDAVFDLRDRETSRTDTASGTTQHGYDAVGNVISETDQLNRVQTTVFDARNRKISETDRNGGVTQFAFDQNGNLLSITDAENKITTYVYDARNLLTQETFPAGQQTPGTTDRRTYTYDPGRRLASRTDQAGVVTTYQYDAANRLVARQYPDGLNDTYGYDTIGRLISAVSARYGSTVRRFYTDNGEHAGRLTREEQVIGGTTYTVGYGYSADNQPTAVTYPDGTVLGRSFTARKELAQVTLGGGLVANRSYDDAGRLVATTLGNGLTETRTYVPNDHLVASIVTPGVTHFTYSYDAAKRKTAEDDGLDPLRNQAFGYDPAGRMTSWQRDGQESQNWQLSLVGDWQSTTRNGATETRTHSDVHEATSLTTAGVTTPLLYDQKGNLAQDQEGRALTWDVENRLFQARDVSNAILGSYSYDALGRRIGKTLGNGSVTVYIHDGARVVVEVGGSTMKRFAHGSYIDEVLAFDVGSVRSFVSANHFYSPATVTSAAGSVIERFTYDSTGRQTIRSASGEVLVESMSGLGRGFLGYLFDKETALLHARSRAYSARLGLFLARNGYLQQLGWAFKSDHAGPALSMRCQKSVVSGAVYIDGLNSYMPPMGLGRWMVDPSGEPGTLIEVGTGAVIGLVTGTLTELVVQSRDNGPMDWSRVGVAAVGGAVFGGIGGFVGDPSKILFPPYDSIWLVLVGVGGGLAGSLATEVISDPPFDDPYDWRKFDRNKDGTLDDNEINERAIKMWKDREQKMRMVPPGGGQAPRKDHKGHNGRGFDPDFRDNFGDIGC
jgi:YD repeat-containing protein